MFEEKSTSRIKLIITANNLPVGAYPQNYSATIESYDFMRTKFLFIFETPKFPGKDIDFNPVETKFIFGKTQRLRVTIRNNENEGAISFDISELIKNAVIYPLNSANGGQLRGNDGKLSTATLSTQNVIIGEEIVSLDLSLFLFKALAKNKKGSLRLYRRNETKWAFLRKSEDFVGTFLNISIQLPLDTLCGNDVRRELFIAVICNEDPIASAVFTLSNQKELLKNGLILGKTEKNNKAKKKPFGRVVFNHLKRKRRFNILSYLKNGMCITPIYAVDFTADAHSATSTPSQHHVNQCLSAIKAIDQAVNAYADRNRRCLLWGFGGLFGSQQADCFSLTFDRNAPFVNSVDELDRLYAAAAQKTAASARKVVSGCVSEGLQIADLLGPNHYVVAFVLSNNRKFDVLPTLAALAGSRARPISFVFVGIGPGSFGGFRSFLGRGGPLDPIDFVKYEDVLRCYGEIQTQHIFSFQCLSNIESHILSYKKQNGERPSEKGVKDIDSVLNKLDLIALERMAEQKMSAPASVSVSASFSEAREMPPVETEPEKPQDESCSENWAKIRTHLELMDTLASAGEHDDLASAEELATIRVAKRESPAAVEEIVCVKRTFDELAPIKPVEVPEPFQKEQKETIKETKNETEKETEKETKNETEKETKKETGRKEDAEEPRADEESDAAFEKRAQELLRKLNKLSEPLGSDPPSPEVARQRYTSAMY